MEQKYVRLILEGSIPRYLFRQTGIMFMGVLLLTSFTLVDIYFIAQIDTQALTAVSFTTTPVLLVVSFMLGIGSGIAAVLSNKIGARNEDKINKVLKSSLWLGGAIGLAFTISGYLIHEWVFAWLGADDAMISKIGEYMFMLYPGFTLLSLLVVALSIIRAYGNTSIPSMSAALIVIINAGLDPLLIFGWKFIPALGVKGAALATCIGLTIGLAFAFIKLWQFGGLPKYLLSGKEVTREWREILHIATPIATTNALLPLGNSFIVKLLAEQNEKAVAAYGIGYRIDMFAILFFTALTATLTPFIGQNRGVNNTNRITRGILYSMGGAVSIAILLANIFYFARQHIGSFFTEEPPVLSYLETYLGIVPLGYAFNGILMISLAVLTVSYQPLKAALLAILHLFGLYIPLAFWLADTAGVLGIFWAYPISLLVASVLGLLLIKKYVTSGKLPKITNSL